MQGLSSSCRRSPAGARFHRALPPAAPGVEISVALHGYLPTSRMRPPLALVLLLALAATGGAGSPEQVQQKITEIYRKHSPEKMGKVAGLLEKYAGHEEELLESVMEKYGLSDEDMQVEPVEPAAFQPASAGQKGAAAAAAEEEEEEEEQEQGEEKAASGLEVEDQMLKILEEQLARSLDGSKRLRNLADLRATTSTAASSTAESRKARQAEVVTWLEDLLESADPRPVRCPRERATKRAPAHRTIILAAIATETKRLAWCAIGGGGGGGGDRL